ncbi:hypothetical protein [Cetobacterium sp.]|uniref:hypothetical protein n=1 Tax=Cetobacterium sp. TaxID=2071632 RepID=UPI003F365F51
MKTMTKGYEDIINHFYQFDMNDYDNKAAKKLNNELEKENQFLRKELKNLEREFEKLKNTNLKNHSFEILKKSLDCKYPNLTEDSIKALATAEYLFLNEKIEMDYSPIYINYVKVLELEIKNKLNLYEKLTFGGLIEKIGNLYEFKTFIDTLMKNRIIEMRNRATHLSDLKKIECGKIRNVLLSEGWLERLLYILESFNGEKIKEVDLDITILDADGCEFFKNKLYTVYTTLDDKRILSNKNIKLGNFKGKGKEIEYNNLTYILI